MSGVRGLVDARATSTPDVDAFLDGRDGASITWQEVGRHASAWRAAMAIDSLAPGDRVGLVIEDPLVFAAAYLGGIGAGATVVPIDPRTPIASIDAAARRCRLTVVASDRTDAVFPLPQGGPAVGRWLVDRRGPDVVVPAPPAAVRPTLAVRPAALLTSSGTTGEPKGIPLGEHHLLLAAERIAHHHELDAADRGYSSLPMFHINAQVVGVLSTLVTGGSLILDRSFEREAYWSRVEALGATWVNAVPAILSALLTVAPPRGGAATVRFVRSASAPLPASTARAFTAHTGLGVLETFGMTEAASQITANPLDACARRPGSVGQAVGVEVAVVDADGRAVDAGEFGRIVLSGEGVVTEYLRLSSERDESLYPARGRDGWLDSGDLGTFDSDGYLTIAGRSDDVINRGGEKFHPLDVEVMLAAHPAVTEAAVVAKPHPRLGAVPVAFVTVAGPPRPELGAALLEWCRSRVPSYQCPVEVRVVPALAKGPTGKVLRRVHRAELATDEDLPASTASRRHVDALDVVRICAVALVIGVHTLSFGGGRLTTPVGAFVTLFHSSREIFFLLTSFALTYAYGRRPVQWGDFWRRRYLLVIVPYLGWSAIYFLLHRRQFDPVAATAARFAHDLLNGGAQYHLYFLLVSMEIYLVFPLVRWVVRRTAGHHGALFAVAAAYQVVVTLAIEHHARFSGVLERWFAHPDPLLPSYLFYVLVGAIAAWHLDVMTEFVRRRMTVVVGLVVAAVGAGVGTYLSQVASGASASTASAVFQPVVIAESVAFALGLFALGQRWADRGSPHRRLIHAGADGSFGIFLAHPLVLQAVLSVSGSLGLLGAVRRSVAPLEIAALLIVAVPLVYALSGALTALARRTPASLVLTGRRFRSTRSSVTPVRPVAARSVAAAAFVHPIHQEA